MSKAFDQAMFDFHGQTPVCPFCLKASSSGPLPLSDKAYGIACECGRYYEVKSTSEGLKYSWDTSKKAITFSSASVEKEECLNCKYFRWGRRQPCWEPDGECRIDKPGIATGHPWPPVWANDWCGAWKHDGLSKDERAKLLSSYKARMERNDKT